jgi:type IV secretory pathway component VirB8
MDKASLAKGEISPALTMNLQMALNATRQWQLISIILGVFAACLLIIIMIILPLKEVDVRYVEFLSGRDIHYTLHPARIGKNQKQLLINKALRNFVNYAHTSDLITERSRFLEVKSMSNSTVFNQMKDWYKELRSSLGENGTRDVNIIYSQPITESIHEVEFETIDTISDRVVKKTWVAKIGYQVKEANTIITDDAIYNPLGIEVTKYHVIERKHSNE